jgi:hypothetical protein
MPNEFIARNGLIALDNSSISGSLRITGSISASGDIVPITNNVGNIGSGTRYFNGIFGTNITYLGIISSNAGEIRIQQTETRLNSTYTLRWSQTSDSNGTRDVGLRRFRTGSLEIFDGVTADGTLANRRDLLVRNISSSFLYVTGSPSSTLLQIDSPVSSSILFVTGSGRVGINTNNPSYLLDVSGSARLNGRTFFGNNASYWLDPGISSSDPTWGGALKIDGGAWLGASGQKVRIGSYTTPTARLDIIGLGATSATTTLLIQNSTPSTLLTILDNGQYTYTGPLLTLATSQSAYVISQSISSSNTVGGQVYGVNIIPTFWQTTASQTETAFRVAATFNTSSVLATGGTNIIADFGASSVGSQLTVTDVTSGSIYMVNDVSGLPIIEATSDWTVNIYNFPNLVFQKTGSQVNINGTLRVSGSFILPLSQSVSPQTGSAYWSGSFLFIWDGTRYRSSSFA